MESKEGMHKRYARKYYTKCYCMCVDDTKGVMIFSTFIYKYKVKATICGTVLKSKLTHKFIVPYSTVPYGT